METSNSEITTLAAAVEADAKPEAASGGESDPPVKVADTSEDTSSWTEKAQKRYDELTRKTYEALGERDRERYQREASEARATVAEARLAALEKAKTSETATQESFPTLEQFGYDEAKFVAAVAAFTKSDPEAIKAAAREAAQEELKLARQADAANKADQEWAAREAELIKSKPDYVDKVKNAATLPISRDVQMALKDSLLGPQIALYLVENAEIANKLLQLPIQAQLMEVGRITAKLEAVKASAPLAVSKAPPPPSKVEGNETSLVGISTTDPASDKMTDDAWVKAENARLKRKSKAG